MINSSRRKFHTQNTWYVWQQREWVRRSFPSSQRTRRRTSFEWLEREEVGGVTGWSIEGRFLLKDGNNPRTFFLPPPIENELLGGFLEVEADDLEPHEVEEKSKVWSDQSTTPRGREWSNAFVALLNLQRAGT